MDGASEYNAKLNKPVRQRQIPNDFTHTWNLRNKTKKQRKKKQRQTKKLGLKHREQTDDYHWGGGWGMGDKDEGD